MAALKTRDDLIDYTLRRLGAPVIEINVDREQLEDRMDDALEFFRERHFDGVEREYFQHKITSADITNKYVNTTNLTNPIGYTGGEGPVGKDILSVVKVHRFGDGTSNMFDVRYQMALNDYFGINRNLTSYSSSMGLASYDSTKRYISLLEQMFEPEKIFRFSKVTNRLHIDMDWDEDTTAGKFLVIETYCVLDPEKFGEIYNDRLLKKYYASLVKRQWGNNLSKFDNVALPGGAILRGGQLVQEAEQEIVQIEEEVRLTYELPIDFNVG